MGDEHLDTIPAMESDKFIKFSVENLVPNPSESKGEHECDVPGCDDFTTFSNLPFDVDDDFSSTDCDPEEEIHLVKRLLFDNSSPRPPKHFNSKNSDAIIESFSLSSIPVEDSDPFMKEIDLFLASNGSIPPGLMTVRMTPTRKSLLVRSEKTPVVGSVPPAEEEPEPNREGATFPTAVSITSTTGWMLASCSPLVKSPYSVWLPLPLSSKSLSTLASSSLSTRSGATRSSRTHTAKHVTRDPAPVAANFNAQDYATLFVHPFSFRKFPKAVMCLVGLSRHYTLDEETYPRFLHKNEEGGMHLLWDIKLVAKSIKCFLKQLEKFQDDQIKVVNDKFDKLYTDFVEMAIHLKKKFYPHLLTTIFDRRWLLTQGVELAIIKCLNSLEYFSALEAAIGKAIEKGTKGTSNTAAATADATMALSTTFASASTIAPISVDDYEVIGVDNQVVTDRDAASFPNRSRLIYKASLFCIRSTSAVLSVGMLISAGMTASVPYVNENRVSPLLDFIIMRDNLSWESESTNNVVPHKFFDLIASDGCNQFRFNPLVDGVSFRKRSGYVNSPFVEQPWRSDWS
nr:hypothetical protein [Tanacetum cinerariifolium]